MTNSDILRETKEYFSLLKTYSIENLNEYSNELLEFDVIAVLQEVQILIKTLDEMEKKSVY